MRGPPEVASLTEVTLRHCLPKGGLVAAAGLPKALPFCVSARVGQARPGGGRLLGTGAVDLSDCCSLPGTVQTGQVSPEAMRRTPLQAVTPLLGSLGAAVITNSV